MIIMIEIKLKSNSQLAKIATAFILIEVAVFVLLKEFLVVDVQTLAEEFGSLQLCQNFILLIALIISFKWVLKNDSPHALGAFFLGLCFFLFWRELDIDKEIFSARMFSWNYLYDDDLSFIEKAGLFLTSLTLIFTWIRMMYVRRSYIKKEFNEFIKSKAFWWLVMAIGVLAVAQLWDKADSVQRNFGITIPVEGNDPFPEEMMELIGGTLLMFAVLSCRFIPLTQRDKSLEVQDDS